VSTALVLSAGGLFTAWEAGVWKALYGRFQPDLIVGASGGALNGWAIAGGCSAEELAREWMDPLTAHVMEFALHRRGCFTPDRLYDKARELFERFQPRVPFGLTLTEIPRMRPRLVCDSEITWQHLAATCSIPFGYPPMQIGGRSYVDGGVLGATPVWAAEQMGANFVVAANCLTAMWSRALRTVIRPRRPSATVKVVLIEPSEPLGSLRDTAVWSEAKILRWIEMGERDGERAYRERIAPACPAIRNS
jgi:NTE family protein